MGARKHPDAKERKPSVWEKTPTPCLIKYRPSGTYYMRARFYGPPIRESLRTDDYRIARTRLAERMSELRAVADHRGTGPETLHAAIRVVRDAVAKDPSIKKTTRRGYLEEIDYLLPDAKTEIPDVKLSRLTVQHVRDWWQKAAATYSPGRANHALMFLKRAVAIGKKAGIVRGDPFDGINRVKIPRTRLRILSAEQFRSLVASIREQGKAYSEESACWVEFAAYSGLRPAEIDAVEWRDIGPDSITVRGGEQGTKNYEVRQVPIIPPMRDLLGRMQRGTPTTRVFSIQKPRESLKNACQRLSLPHLRPYDLRHTFASFCVASGVDVPLLAKWLGHRDGGALAMKTYIHSSDQHSQQSAAKVTFL